MTVNSQNSSLDNYDEQTSLRELIVKIRDWYKYILTKWLFILIVGIVGAIVGFIYAYYKKPVFIASTTFVLENEDSGRGMGQYAGLASMVGIDLGGMAGGGGIFQGDNILVLYKSRKMIKKTLLSGVNYDGNNELLIDRYIKINHLRESWRKKKSLAKIYFGNDSNADLINVRRLKDSIITLIVDDINKNYLSVSKLDKKLSIIKVDVRSKDEIFAKAFNDQIVKNVNDFYIQTKTKKSLNNISILQQKTDSVRLSMNRSIYTSAAVVDATVNLNPTKQVQRIAPMQRSQFNAETNKAMLTELVKNLEMAKMSLLKETPLIQVVDNPVFPLEVEKIGKIKALVLGGILFVFVVVLALSIRKVLLISLI
ncbi:GumC domain-containing protein [Pedobacter nutrimenti]|uniref:Subunit length determinant protein n=1 Tax=Pedobacter nutrimenti TaxID=1241337 RepID=A0A318UGH9_9SPHI|nr:lipopolysaccharide biosynthesis protein [Pedobacter nutrimenti]PYF75462.1 hypothetical protein B0O44_10211 [Pedobacter nutrimenti]